MQINSISIIIFILSSCLTNRPTKGIVLCNENQEFKKIFFSKIDYIDKKVGVIQDSGFNEALYFLAKYVHVSLESRLNYAHLYPFGVYKDDRIGWIKWYDSAKCSNLQIK